MDVAALSDGELVEQVRTWAARVARGEAELLDLIGELDAREAWAGHGVMSCAHWLSWQLGYSGSTARERVRVARALRVLPLIREELGRGGLSYSQVRAVTRLATPEDEGSWVELARRSTGAQLELISRGADRARAAEVPVEQRPVKPAARVEWDDDGDLLLTVRVPAHLAVPVLAVLEEHQKAAQAEREAAVQQLLTDVLAAGATGEGAAGSGAAGSAAAGSGASAEASQLALDLDTDLDADFDLDTTTDTGLATDRPEPAVASAEAAAPVGASAEAVAEPLVPELLVPELARGLDPLQRYPYVEPDFPIGADRFGLGLSDADHAAISAWEVERDRLRAVRDAWNDRRELLLRAASAQRVPTGKATLADALVRALTRPEQGPKVTVRLLEDPLSGWARTVHDELLPPATVTDLLRSLPGRRVRRDGVVLDLTRCDQGRDSRAVPPALRRLLGELDGERCRFPGCRHTRFLHAHHLEFWSTGGRTDLANLILLCTRHHRLLHQLGYQLTLDPDRNLQVRCPDGTLLEHHPRLPAASAEALPPAPPGPLEPGYLGDRLDVGYAVNVMLNHAA